MLKMITFAELLERIKTEKIVVHTPMEEKAVVLLKMLDKRGFTWVYGDKLTTETYYEDYKEKTCYSLLDKEIMFGPLNFYQEHDYTIIEFKAIEFKEDE